MKTWLAVLLTILVLGQVFAAGTVTVKSELNSGTSWGDTKAMKNAPGEITVGQFNINYMTTRVAGAAAGNGASRASVTVRAELDLAPADAQAITDAAYAYLKQQLEAKGYKVRVHDADALKAAKQFQKFAKKDPAAVVGTGGPQKIANKDKVDERIATFATGVAGAYLGPKGDQGYVPLAMEMAGKESHLVLGLVGTVDFTEAAAKSSQSGMLDDYNRASVAFKPALRLIDDPKFGGQTTFNFFSAKAIGGKVFGGNVYVYGGEEWVVSHGLDKDSVWQLKINQTGFRNAVESMLKGYIDRVVTRVDEAKKNGK